MPIHGVSVQLSSNNLGFQVKNEKEEKISVVVDYHCKEGSRASKRFDLEAKSVETYDGDVPLKSANVAGYFLQKR